jgi:hypothetical protein
LVRAARKAFYIMSYTGDQLATRTFLDMGRWHWEVRDVNTGAILSRGETHGGEGEAHLRAVHALDMLKVGDADETLV